jgi:hypothetical protein
VRGALSRLWWGRTIDDSSERIDQLHVPIAADIARVSADLLYSQPPSLVAADTSTQARLDQYMESGLSDVLASGAEIGAALGGRYHRVTWDAAMGDAPFLTTIDADAAWPEFRWGQLVAATVWHVVHADGQRVLRHLERHELDPSGIGLVYHGLYDGGVTTLGHAVPLADHPSTAGLAALVDEEGALIEGRTPGLCIEYIPNQLPQRRWRRDPLGCHLGRSDYDGVEPLMDAVDETYSSLMRDIRIGKGRIIVPAYMLENNGPGRGASFSLDRSVYEAINSPMPEDGRGEVSAHQLAIRVDEHLRTCDDLISRIISTAGYSSQTMSDGMDSGAMTATEVHARERRSYLTRGRKIRGERPAIMRLAAKMLTIDAAVFGTPGLSTDPVTVTFGPGVQDSPLALAQTIQALDVARAISTITKVRALHTEWTEEDIEAEVVRITMEQGMEPLTSPDILPPGDMDGDASDPAAVREQAEAMGMMIRAGVESSDAADKVGLGGLAFTGAVPTSLRLPEADAAQLEGV